MTINETVLQRLAEWRPPGEGRQTLATADEGSGWSVSLSADRREEVGSLFWEVVLQATAPKVATTAALQNWASAAAKRVQGLLEPLKVIEIDSERGEAILRSDVGSKAGSAVCYYEILMKGTASATLRRFRGFLQNSQRREQISFALTHEALAKVIDDVAASL